MAKPRRYEALVLLDVGLNEEKLEQVIDKFKEIITSSEGGEIINLDRWGKKRLAYEIKKKQFGYYVLCEFTSQPSVPTELDRFCRLEVGIIRHQILHIPERVIKLKAKEERIRAAMEQRRLLAAEKGDDNHIEDMLEPAIIKEEIPEDLVEAELIGESVIDAPVEIDTPAEEVKEAGQEAEKLTGDESETRPDNALDV